MEVQELIGALFNIVLVVMIVATIMSAGINTTTLANLGLELAHSMAHPKALAQAFQDGAASLATAGIAGAGIRSPVKTPSRTEPAANLVEPLTDREMAVLRLLPTRLSNKEIAAELFLSINTVKSRRMLDCA
jgi:DNA-binding NarL/FixJ family response regulator